MKPAILVEMLAELVKMLYSCYNSWLELVWRRKINELILYKQASRTLRPLVKHHQRKILEKYISLTTHSNLICECIEKWMFVACAVFNPNTMWQGQSCANFVVASQT